MQDTDLAAQPLRLSESMRRSLADPFDLFTDTGKRGEDVPGTRSEWRLPDKLPEEREIKAAIAELSEKTRDVELGMFKAALKMIAYATRHKDEKAIDWKYRTRVYYLVLKDVPADMWKDLTMQVIRSCGWFPAAAEIDRLVRPYVEQRLRMLERARRILAAVKARATPAAVAPTRPMTADEQRWASGERLRSSIEIFTKRGMPDRAANAERTLAALEQRDVEPWAKAAFKPKTATMVAPPPPVAPLKSSPASEAALKRSLARSHRTNGGSAYADKLDAEADALAPRPGEPIFEPAQHG